MTAFARWLAAAAVLILAGIVVPYGILSGPPEGLGLSAFWLVFGVAVIALILWGVAGWRRG